MFRQKQDLTGEAKCRISNRERNYVGVHKITAGFEGWRLLQGSSAVIALCFLNVPEHAGLLIKLLAAI